MKSPSHSKAKHSGNYVYTQDPVTVVSLVALIAMFSTISISVLWEMFAAPDRTTKDRGKVYTYPVFVNDFDSVLRERKQAIKKYGHRLETAGVERRSNLSLQEFWDLYDGKWPVILTDVVKTWPASNWTKEMLNKTYGNEQVVMVATRGSLRNFESLSLPLHLFVSHVNENSPQLWTYITDEIFITTRPELRAQVRDSIYTEENFFQLFPPEIKPWDCMLLWGTTHSRSHLHIDPYNWTGTNAVIFGTKKWKLFPPGQDHLLYTTADAVGGFPLTVNKYSSEVDAFAPASELKQYPLFKKAKYIEVEQKPGEMLFIPTGWFHQAYNSEETLAISGQIMNRNNYRFILEEILKAGHFQRKQLPKGFHNLLPPDQVNIFMSLLPERILKKGREHTQRYIDLIKTGGEKDRSNLPAQG